MSLVTMLVHIIVQWTINIAMFLQQSLFLSAMRKQSFEESLERVDLVFSDSI